MELMSECGMGLLGRPPDSGPSGHNNDENIAPIYGGPGDHDFFSDSEPNTNNFNGFDSSSANKSIHNLNSLSQQVVRIKEPQSRPTVSNNLNGIQGKNLVVLVEPVSHHDPEVVDVKKFFGNDYVMSKSVYNSNFGKEKIIQISKNLKKNILIIEFDKTCTTNIDNLLKINRIADWEVKCRLPRIHTMSYGVIGPIGPDTTDEQIEEDLKEKGYVNVEAKRLVKGKDKIRTVHVRIGLEVATLPEYVIVAWQRFAVRTYVDKPWQCYKCQTFGHNASQCNGRIKCVVCSGPHSLQECKVKNKEEIKCSNCGENHTSSYGGCKFMKRAKLVEKVRAEDKLSYRDAVKKIKSLNDERNVVAHNNIQIQPATTARDNSIVIATSKGNTENYIENIETTAETSCDNEPNINNERKKLINEVKHEIITCLVPQLLAAMIKVMSLKWSEDTNENYNYAVTEVIKQTLGVEMPNIDIESCLWRNKGKEPGSNTVQDKEASIAIAIVNKNQQPVLTNQDQRTYFKQNKATVSTPHQSKKEKKKSNSPNKSDVRKRTAQQSNITNENPVPNKKKTIVVSNKLSGGKSHSEETHVLDIVSEKNIKR